jgi:hypothetical protein
VCHIKRKAITFMVRFIVLRHTASSILVESNRLTFQLPLIPGNPTEREG